MRLGTDEDEPQLGHTGQRLDGLLEPTMAGERPDVDADGTRTRAPPGPHQQHRGVVSVHDIGEQPQAMATGRGMQAVPPAIPCRIQRRRAPGRRSPGRRRRGIRSSHNQSPERPFSLLMLLDLLTGKLDDAARRTNQQLT